MGATRASLARALLLLLLLLLLLASHLLPGWCQLWPADGGCLRLKHGGHALQRFGLLQRLERRWGRHRLACSPLLLLLRLLRRWLGMRRRREVLLCLLSGASLPLLLLLLLCLLSTQHRGLSLHQGGCHATQLRRWHAHAGRQRKQAGHARTARRLGGLWTQPTAWRRQLAQQCPHTGRAQRTQRHCHCGGQGNACCVRLPS